MSDYIINFTDPLKGSFLIRAYTSNGTKFPTTDELNESSIAADSALLLYGKGHADYGERTDENLLNLLENFSGASMPAILNAGMLWHKEVLYYRNSSGGQFEVSDGDTGWSNIGLFGTGSLPTTAPVGIQDGDYWYDNTGSPTVLYQWSADERNIDDWIAREFDEDVGSASGAPVKELQIYDGNNWDILPDLTQVNSLIASTGALHLNLDTSNGPLTGNLEIAPGGAPTLTLTGADATVAFNTDWTATIDDSGSPVSGSFRILTTGTPKGLVIRSDGLLSVLATNYNTLVTDDDDIPNKLYVDNQIGSVAGADRYIESGTFSTSVLTLTYFSGSPSSFDVTGFTSDQILFTTGTLGTDVGGGSSTTVDEALTKAAPISDPTFVGIVNIPSITDSNGPNEAANKAYVDSEISNLILASAGTPDALRDVQPGGGTSFVVSFSYTVGNNRLMVFKNGVKQYKDVQASATAEFIPSLISSQELNGLPTYFITGVNLGSNTWTISGDHSADFTAGDTFEVISNGGGGDGNYTVVSASPVAGSPTTETDIVVTSIVSGDVSGTLGIDYEFDLTIDGVNNTVTPVNLVSLGSTVDDLITAMQTAIDLVFGAGAASAYLFDGDIKVDSLSIAGGSPAPGATMANGSVPTSDLYDALNLGVDGFTGLFTGVSSTAFGYYESDAGGNVAQSGSDSTYIDFHLTTSAPDVIEFLRV
jgi:hypothetical protein